MAQRYSHAQLEVAAHETAALCFCPGVWADLTRNIPEIYAEEGIWGILQRVCRKVPMGVERERILLQMVVTLPRPRPEELDDLLKEFSIVSNNSETLMTAMVIVWLEPLSVEEKVITFTQIPLPERYRTFGSYALCRTHRWSPCVDRTRTAPFDHEVYVESLMCGCFYLCTYKDGHIVREQLDSESAKRLLEPLAKTA
jgi:hypothetical protein